MGDVSWAEDVGWDKPKVTYPGGDRYKLVTQYVSTPGLLCSYAGGQYMFLDVRNCWVNFASSGAISRLCDIVGIKNATVNYAEAAKPMMPYITKRCDANVSQPIPTSVCIGTRRLEIGTADDGVTLVFTSCRPLLEQKAKYVPIEVYSLAIMPVDLSIYPTSFKFPGKASLLGYVSQLFPDVTSLITVMWIVGNCILDPQDNPKSLFLAGPGGSGKSTVLQVIYKALARCCDTLPDGCLTGYAKAMGPVISEVVTSSRMAVCFDVDLEKDPLNMAIFKNISGSDYIRVGFNTCKSSCSLALATNGYVDPKAGNVYKTDAIMRRAVAVMMNVNAIDIPKAQIPSGVDDLLDFVCSCLHIKLKYPYLPVSPLNVVLTICGSRYFEIVDLLEETLDTITTVDAQDVLSLVSQASGVALSEVPKKAKLISPFAVVAVHGELYLRGIRLRR